MRTTLINNRYALGDLLGSGGMAEVYLVDDEVLDRDVALKILKNQYAENGEFVERFRREAQSAAALNHPNIVSVYDRGRSEDGTYYIVMEYVPGGTLKDRVRGDGPLDPGNAAGLGSQVARALGFAHERGVIHRDVKSQNILLTETGDAKVTDFGIARAATATTTSRSNLILGTAGYMSPEQAKGEHVGPRSDLYSLGVVLYEMLTGELPYSAEDPVALAMKHVNEPPRSPKEANPEVPEALDALTTKLLAKNPEDRYASAAALADDLERLRSGIPQAAASEKTSEKMAPPLLPSPEGQTRETAVQPRITPTPIRGPEHGRRRRQGRLFLVLAALLLGLALLGGLAGALTQGFFGAGSVEVPSLESLTREEAQERLAESGLTLGDAGEAPSDSAPKGTIIEQDPQAGASVEPETPVNITLSSGPERVTVPELAGLSPSEAERALSETGLKLGRSDEAPSDTVPVGVVIEQDPAGGTKVEEGTAVDIVVSTGPQQPPAVQATPALESPAPPPPAQGKKAAKRAEEDRKERGKGKQKGKKQKNKD